MTFIHGTARALELFEDVGGAGHPDEKLRAFVAMVGVFVATVGVVADGVGGTGG